ncbi:hypothetical protein CBR_g45660 [Chara braunii]|uniref:HMG box domain-containing protein n=1 Tax=Chara braunii TaxID=69332 RepID=A0A388K3T3_CHABU|nr:hypothetical protein CBR_g45660 [Chara braunii]|eukprot:GBG64603.1 hypothetical protein CBR_g45660 [Chara braunii]
MARSRRGRRSGRRKRKRRRGPKRALPPYMFFCKQQRKSVIEEHPDASFGDVGKILGQKWRRMSDVEKKPFLSKAVKDKKRYRKQMRKRAKKQLRRLGGREGWKTKSVGRQECLATSRDVSVGKS